MATPGVVKRTGGRAAHNIAKRKGARKRMQIPAAKPLPRKKSRKS